MTHLATFSQKLFVSLHKIRLAQTHYKQYTLKYRTIYVLMFDTRIYRPEENSLFSLTLSANASELIIFVLIKVDRLEESDGYPLSS